MTKSTGKVFKRPSHWTLEEVLERYSADGPRGCRLWKRGKFASGYGSLLWKRRQQAAHRWAWIAANGEIPTGMQVLHKCDVRACIRLDHLFLGTHKDNMTDMAKKGRAPYGERNAIAKLTNEQALSIFHATGPQRAIARLFGVDQAIVLGIKKKTMWRRIHLDPIGG